MFPAGDEVAQPAVPAGLTLAPIGRRMIGLILYQILVALPVVLVVIALGYTPSDSVTSRALLIFNVALIATAFVYETVMIAMLGRTVGKYATGIRVVRLIDGQRPTWSSSVMRSLVPLSLGAIPRIGVFLSVMCYAMALWNPLRQGLHDKAAGTLVVYNSTVD
jgi:uncharacterized RDD family membrane protein YckC